MGLSRVDVVYLSRYSTARGRLLTGCLLSATFYCVGFSLAALDAKASECYEFKASFTCQAT